MAPTNKPRMPEIRRPSRTAAARCFSVAAGGAFLSLLLLSAHVVVPVEPLQLVAVWILGGSLLAVWAGILTWRMPVFGNRALTLFALAWVAGIAASVWLAVRALASRPFVWRLSMQWIAVTLSFVVGALLFRALLRKRTAPRIGRLLSLVSPVIILVVVLVTSFTRSA